MSLRNTLMKDLEQYAESFSVQQDNYDLRDHMYLKVSQMSRFNNLWIVGICFVLGLIMSITLMEKFSSMGANNLGIMGVLFLIDVALPIALIHNRKKELKQYQAIIQKVNHELKSFYDTVKRPIQVAYEYSNPRVIHAIINLLEEERADSLKEAINYLLKNLPKTEILKMKKGTNVNADTIALFSLGAFSDNR